MLKNYITTAIRNLNRFKGYAITNILGLAIGMACVILIMLYVQSELSYDTFHANKDRIYRLNIQTTNPQNGNVGARAVGPYRLAEELKADFPDMEQIVRFADQDQELIEYNNQQFVEERFAFVDPNVFQTFHFPLEKGDPNTALADPFSLVLTQEAAEKYFGEEDPIGKTLTLREHDFAVTGILAKVPENTQFPYDMMASMDCGKQVFSRIVLENWGEGYVETYVMVPEGKRPGEYESRLAAFVDKNLADWKDYSPSLAMQPLPKLYLYSQDISTFQNGGDITYVYAFSLIALFILIIACINFMNLATARSSLRAKEVGVRKVFGAFRGQLISQFLSESILLATISLLLAIGIVYLAIPGFNELAGKEAISMSLLNGPMVFALIAITLFVGIVAGSYPALVLSAFAPIGALSGSLHQGFKGGTLRKVLVAFQFATSIFLLIVTGMVYKQLQYCKNIKLGFEKDHIMIMGAPLEMRGKYDQFQAELFTNPQVVNAGASSRVPPGRLSSSLTARPEGVPEDQQRGMQTVWTDFDFIETMGFELAAGRSFSREFPSDAREGFILNEAAVKEIGWTNESALGKRFGSSEITDWEAGQWANKDGRVIGILKDFHFESLKQKIQPTVYFIAPYMAWNYTIRVKPERLSETIEFIKKKYTAMNPDVPFEYRFVDENFTRLYQQEEAQGKIFGIFAALAIFIACLGLVGLASFTAERKRKEIGIRKVLGASSYSLVMLLSKEFAILVAIAFLIAVPFSLYTVHVWLEEFAYRTPINILVFIGAGLVTGMVAWITVGYLAARAARMNPADVLRNE